MLGSLCLIPLTLWAVGLRNQILPLQYVYICIYLFWIQINLVISYRPYNNKLELPRSNLGRRKKKTTARYRLPGLLNKNSKSMLNLKDGIKNIIHYDFSEISLTRSIRKTNLIAIYAIKLLQLWWGPIITNLIHDELVLQLSDWK